MSFRGNNSQVTSDSDSDSNSNSHSFRSRSPIKKSSIAMALPQIPVNQIPANQNPVIQIPVLKSEYLNMIPDFNGEPELLPRFIQICEKLVVRFYNSQNINDFQNEYLMSSILAKIKGSAAVNISSCVINSWLNLKNALMNSYGDKRDCYSLNIELTELKQGNETPFEFYNKIQGILNLQTSYLSTHMNANEANVLTEYFRNYALRVLLRGLREPIGSQMRTKNPIDLNIALHMLTNDFQLETKNQCGQNKIVHKNTFQNATVKNVSPQNNFRSNTQYFPKQNTFNNSPNQFNRSFNTPNFSRNTNVFKPNPNQNFPKPVPMSISTRNTYQLPKGGNTNFRPPFRQNYVPGELHNIDGECAEIMDDSHFLEEQASNHPMNL